MKRLFLVLLLIAAFVPYSKAQMSYNYPADPWGGNTTQPCTNPSWPPATIQEPTGTPATFRLAITGITRNGSNVTTVTLASAATLVNGQQVIITGVADNSFNTSGNGTKATAAPTITISGNTFTYSNAGSAGSSSGGFAVPANWYQQIQTSLSPNRWYWCSPLGNHMQFQGITAGEVIQDGPMLTSKYAGNKPAAANDALAELGSWNFNGLGDQFQCGNCPSVANINFTDPFQYSTNNLRSQSTDATKDWRQLVSPAFATSVHENNPIGCIDFFAPEYATFVNGWFLTQESVSRTSSDRIGVAVGDSGGSGCAAIGADFASFPVNHNSSQPAWLAIIASPIDTYQKLTDRAGFDNIGNSGPPGAWLYSDVVNYTKTPMATPPASCSLTTPCSIATFLTKKYSTVGALNTAWSSTYTTLGSSGTCLGYSGATATALGCAATGSAVSVGTGDGTTLSFPFSTHANLDPFSVQILVNGTPVAGDCPQFRNSGGAGNGTNGATCGGSVGTGAILGTNISGGSCTYSTGACTVTWTAGNAPANGATITANVIWGGWPKGGPGGGGTGLLDEDGTSSWIGTNGVCLLNVGAGTPGTTSYVCRPGGTYSAPNANQTFAADMQTTWEPEYFAQGLSLTRTGLKGAAPNLMYGSPETTGNWTMPPYKSLLQACNIYCDWAYASDYAAGLPDSATRAAMLSYYSTYYTGPMISGMLRTSCPDSAMANLSGNSGSSCQGSTVFSATQPARALEYFNSINEMLTKPSANNTIQWVGNTWWSLNDCDTDHSSPNNWGLKTCGGLPNSCAFGKGYVDCSKNGANNAYNGVEPTSSSIACSSPSGSFTCGSEPAPVGTDNRPYGNLLGGTTGVVAANALWFTPGGGGNPAASTPTALPTVGTYASAQSITLSTSSAGAIICYNFTGAPSTNGAANCPANSLLYAGPISVSSTETLYAVAGGTGWTDSPIASFPYVIIPTPPSGSGSIPPLIIITSASKCKTMTPSDELCKGYDDLNNLLGSCIVCGL